MLRRRLIPVLLLDQGRLVKTEQFSRPKYVGDPLNVMRIFNEKEVDEIILLDINATSKQSSPDYGLLAELASECFSPLTYGGGIHSVGQAETVLSCGIEKICVKSAATSDPGLVRSLARELGTQAVVVAVDVIKQGLQHKLHLGPKRSRNSPNWLEFAEEVVGAGAGEILLTAVHREGSMNGMDTELISSASATLGVPLVAHGGVGTLKDIEVAFEAGASAVAAGSFFLFHGPHRAVVISYPSLKDNWKV